MEKINCKKPIYMAARSEQPKLLLLKALKLCAMRVYSKLNKYFKKLKIIIIIIKKTTPCLPELSPACPETLRYTGILSMLHAGCFIGVMRLQTRDITME